MIIRRLCTSTGIAFADVSMLVAHGHGLGAMKIARTCLESAINVEYLCLEPTEYRDFLDWGLIEQCRKVEYMRKYMPGKLANLDPKMVADTEKRYQAVRPRFLVANSKKRLRQSWCRLNLRERAIRANFEGMYSSVYALSSELSHGSFGGLVQHVENIVEGKSQPAIPPSIVGCSQALQTAHYCTFRAVQTLTLLKEIDSTPPLNDLKNDYDYAWQEGRKAAIS
ncbi:MAG: DUF5677 domain-containing protein [Acidobacteriia bacterium]|nr:DUF5677 domain-containing protein [Terriglobia bacterium]